MADNGPIVSNKDIYAQVIRLAGIMEGLQVRNLQADEIHRDHEARIRMLERWRYGLPLSVLVSGGSAAIALAALLLR